MAVLVIALSVDKTLTYNRSPMTALKDKLPHYENLAQAKYSFGLYFLCRLPIVDHCPESQRYEFHSKALTEVDAEVDHGKIVRP